MAKTAVIIGCIDGALPASDRAATALAVTRFGDDVVLCSPRGEETALRYALGAGANDVIPIDECNALVYLVGRGGAGVNGNLMVAQLATARKATLVLDVLDVEACIDGVRVWRDLGRGAREGRRLGRGGRCGRGGRWSGRCGCGRGREGARY